MEDLIQWRIQGFPDGEGVGVGGEEATLKGGGCDTHGVTRDIAVGNQEVVGGGVGMDSLCSLIQAGGGSQILPTVEGVWATIGYLPSRWDSFQKWLITSGGLDQNVIDSTDTCDIYFFFCKIGDFFLK